MFTIHSQFLEVIFKTLIVFFLFTISTSLIVRMITISEFLFYAALRDAFETFHIRRVNTSVTRLASFFHFHLLFSFELLCEAVDAAASFPVIAFAGSEIHCL